MIRSHLEHVTFPNLLRAEREEGVFSLHNPAHGTSLDVEPESGELVDMVLEAFAEPRTLDDFFAAHEDVPEELVLYLVRATLLVEREQLEFLEHGFLRPTSTPTGTPLAWSDLPDALEDWVVLGVPVDAHALGGSGARHGPAEIRRLINGTLLSGEGDVVDWELRRLYPNLQVGVHDLGDIDPEGGRMDHVGSRLRKVVRELLRIGARPLLLGGDHSITHYALQEIAQHVPRFGLIHFDAHPDLLPSRTLSHASVFKLAVEEPRVDPFVQLGLRVIERISPYARREPCPKRVVISAREIASAASILQQLPRDIPYYLSFDIDCIDAASARETGTPAFGGLSFERASELVDYVARTFELLGADFVEVAGAQGALHASASMAASLVQRCLLSASPFEPLTTDVYRFP
ncbi:MAG: arginase family protein [Polyangiales bacterium]